MEQQQQLETNEHIKSHLQKYRLNKQNPRLNSCLSMMLHFQNLASGEVAVYLAYSTMVGGDSLVAAASAT
jgi:hypothetical protein